VSQQFVTEIQERRQTGGIDGEADCII